MAKASSVTKRPAVKNQKVDKKSGNKNNHKKKSKTGQREPMKKSKTAMATSHRFSPWRDGPFTQHLASTTIGTRKAIYARLDALYLCQWHFEHSHVFDLPSFAATHSNLERVGNILRLLDFAPCTAKLQSPTFVHCKESGIFQSSWEIQMQWS